MVGGEEGADDGGGAGGGTGNADDAAPGAAGAEAAVRDYYEALRRGEPLYPYFDESATTAKFGVGETLTGYDAVAEALREQTRNTRDWTVDSRRLLVAGEGDAAYFSDLVELAWTPVDHAAGPDGATGPAGADDAGGTADGADADADGGGDPPGDDVDRDSGGDRLSFETRFSGGLRRRDGEWVFVGMHVSVARDPATGADAGFGTNDPLGDGDGGGDGDGDDGGDEDESGDGTAGDGTGSDGEESETGNDGD